MESFEFAARLADTAGDQPSDFVVLDIRPVDDSAREQIRRVWHKLAQAVSNFHQHTGNGSPHWTNWKIHEWIQSPPSGVSQFAAWDDDCLAGFLSVRFPYVSPVEQALELPYVEHLITFPGNMDTRIWKRRLSHVGVALAGFVASHSRTIGKAGRFALHAVQESEKFWVALGTGIDGFYSCDKTGISGSHPINETQRYFEVSEAGATQFLSRFAT